MRNEKIDLGELLLGFFEVLVMAWDSIMILIAFDLVLLRWITYSSLYTYNYLPNFLKYLIATVKITIIVSVNLFLLKRILYQLEDKEINIKKIFSLEAIKRGFKVITCLFTVNILPYGLIRLLVQDLENNSNHYSFLGLLFVLIITVTVCLFLMFLNFIIIYFEENPLLSLEYMLRLLDGYKIKLIITNTVIFIFISIIIYNQINSMNTLFMTFEEVRKIELMVRNVFIMFGYIMLLLHIGYYNTLKFHKGIEFTA